MFKINIISKIISKKTKRIFKFLTRDIKKNNDCSQVQIKNILKVTNLNYSTSNSESLKKR